MDNDESAQPIQVFQADLVGVSTDCQWSTMEQLTYKLGLKLIPSGETDLPVRRAPRVGVQVAEA